MENFGLSASGEQQREVKIGTEGERRIKADGRITAGRKK
jgi:hypothetical protein